MVEPELEIWLPVPQTHISWDKRVIQVTQVFFLIFLIKLSGSTALVLPKIKNAPGGKNNVPGPDQACFLT